MPLFPLFIDINNKNCTVIGAGKVAYRKICTLLKYGAIITVISPFVCEQIYKLNNNNIKLIEREYIYGDLKNSYIVLACAYEYINIQVYEEIKYTNIYFNCAKPSEKSNFNFPSIVNKGMLSIGISTNGAYPALSSYIRNGIEDILPENIDIYIDILNNFRLKVFSEIEAPETRQKLLKNAIDAIDYTINPIEYNKNILRLLEVYKNED